MLHVGLVLRVVTVVVVLADFQPASSTEHDVDNAQVAYRRGDPLEGSLVGAKAGEEAAGPEKNLSKVVWATDNLVQARITEALGVLPFCLEFLYICPAFHHEAAGHHHTADACPNPAGGQHEAHIGQPEVHRGHLHHVEHRHRKPDGQLEGNSDRLAGLCQLRKGLLVGGALYLPHNQKATETEAVENQQEAEGKGRGLQAVAVHDDHGNGAACHRKTIPYRNEVEEPIPAQATDSQGDTE